MYKISSRYLETWSSFNILMVKSFHFSRCFLLFLYFLDFYFLSDFGLPKSVLWLLFTFLMKKTDLKHVSYNANPNILISPSLDLVTLDDLYHKYVHRKLRIPGVGFGYF